MACPDIIPSRKYFVLQRPSIKPDGKLYTGKEGFKVVPKNIPALMQDDNDVIDKSPWSYGGPQERELKATKYPYTVKEDRQVVVVYGAHHLVLGNRIYPLESLVLESTRFPPQRAMEEWAINCSA